MMTRLISTAVLLVALATPAAAQTIDNTATMARAFRHGLVVALYDEYRATGNIEALDLAVAIFTDGPLTPIGVLKGRTDENGYLRISGGTPGATDGPLTAIGNLKGRTDENGYLRVALAGGTMTSALTIQVDAIGATSTDGLRLKNATAAAAGAQQYSPRTCWEGQGWKTNATAASQSVVFCAETQPVQGTSVPSGNWILKASINGGAFSTVATFDSTSGILAAGNVYAAAASFVGWNGRSRLASTSDGNVQARNNGGTNTFDVTLDDAKTTLSAENLSVAQDGLVFLGAASLGHLYIASSEDGALCTYILRGAANASGEVQDNGGFCTVTKDNAATFNIYYDAAGGSGAGYYFQSKVTATRSVRLTLIGG